MLFDDSDDDADADEVIGDPVYREAKLWAELSQDAVNLYKQEDGMLDEFKMAYAFRSDYPLHYIVFKQTASHRAHEGNAEDTFSLSGSLSNPNTHTGPSLLSALVRINKNKSSFKPESSQLLQMYISKHKKVPTLGEDVTDDDGED